MASWLLRHHGVISAGSIKLIHLTMVIFFVAVIIMILYVGVHVYMCVCVLLYLFVSMCVHMSCVS